MGEAVRETYFAPAERDEPAIVLGQHERFKTLGSVVVLDALPVTVMVLNPCRQLVYGNSMLREALGLESLQSVLGQRPGEIFGCIHARKMKAGCGTSEFCRECGAVRAILSAVGGKASVQECRMLHNAPDGGVEGLDLRVTSTPFNYLGEDFVIFSLQDVSHEQRRRALERVFFHDVLNLAGALSGLTDHLTESLPEDARPSASMLSEGLDRLLDEISSQKDLLAAESHELACHPSWLSALDVTRAVARIHAGHPVARGREVVANEDGGEIALLTDPAILGRALGNMVKNALEASPEGAVVSIGYMLDPMGVRFFVHNPGVMPRRIQLKVFSRSFSTKGEGRGLGTYSIKLLTERYLKGEVGFSSTEEDGTTFYIRLPLEPPNAACASE
ncbi:MAG: sensor histidine kinase [Desulfovibrionaceae bacterium]